MLDLSGINQLAVLVAALIPMVVGTVWYGPLFGKVWMKAAGVTQKEIDSAKKKGMTGTYIVTFIGALIMSFFTAILIGLMGTQTASTGAQAGFIIWLGFVATTHLPHYLFEGRPLSLFFIAVGHHLVELVLMGALLAVWS